MHVPAHERQQAGGRRAQQPPTSCSARPSFLRPHLIPSSACLAAALLPAVALLRVLGQEGFSSLNQMHPACLAVPASAADVESIMSGAPLKLPEHEYTPPGHVLARSGPCSPVLRAHIARGQIQYEVG